MITTGMSAGSGVVFIITGWYLRGQGTFHRDRIEYLWGQVMIVIGLFVLCLSIWQLRERVMKKKKHER